MNHWCESCARKNLCYVVDDRPKCFVPITNTASGTPYLVGISSISRDSHEIAKIEPQRTCDNCGTPRDKCVYCIEEDRMWTPKTEPNSSEKPNNCEHITEDGVTCAKYPACDDCLDNPLNKVKGSERLVKGKDEPQTYVINPQEPTNNDRCFECDDFFTCGGQCNKIEDEPMKTTDYCDICKRDMCEDCIADATNPYCVPSHYEISYEPKDEPQTYITEDRDTQVLDAWQVKLQTERSE